MTLSQEKKFHFHDGSSVGSLKELKKKLEHISYDEFYEHVNEEKNDFANWIEHVLDDKELADKLRTVGSIVETVEIIGETITPVKEQDGYEAMQDKIEQKLFADLDNNDTQPEAEDFKAPETESVEEVPAPPVEVSTPEHAVDAAELPSPEELERPVGEPVVSTDPGHKPITEIVKEQPPHPEHNSFIVRQFMYGMVLGLIAGLILGRLLPI